MTVAGVTAAAVALAAVVTAPSSGVVAVAVAVVFDMMDGLVLTVTAAVSTVGTRPSSGVLKGRAEALCECWMLSQSQAQSLQTDKVPASSPMEGCPSDFVCLASLSRRVAAVG